MIIGARTASGLLLVDDFDALDVSLWLTTEDGSAGQQGVVTDVIPQVIAHASVKPKMVYACGPTGMLAAVATRCQAENIPAQLSWEAHMRCGMGLCGSCEVGQGWLTCLDGPVFPFDPVTTPTSDRPVE
jgi:dihydroorotate dehydrogenase electron transfer subunit